MIATAKRAPLAKYVEERRTPEREWEQYKRLVHKEVWKQVHRYGGDREEYLSIAGEAFAVAYDTWDQEKGAFSTHLTWTLFYAFKKSYYRHVRNKKVDVVDDEVFDNVASTPRSIMSRLSEDAKRVAELALDTPWEILDLAKWKRNKHQTVRNGIIRYLKNMGWSPARISEAIQEIKEQLVS